MQRNVRLPRREASPDFLPPVGGKDPGGQGYVHHIALVPIGTPPPITSRSHYSQSEPVVIILPRSHCSYPVQQSLFCLVVITYGWCRGVIILNPDTVVIILAGSHCSYPCPAVIVLPPTAVLTIVRGVIILNPNR